MRAYYYKKSQDISEVFFSMVGLLVDRPSDVVVTVLPTVAGSVLGAMSATATLQLSLDFVEKSAV